MSRENSGLTYCVPLDFVKEIYDVWLATQKPVETPEVNSNPEPVKEKTEQSENQS